MHIPGLGRADAEEFAFLASMQRTADDLAMPLLDLLKKARTDGMLQPCTDDDLAKAVTAFQQLAGRERLG